jgi:hypothetical protein
LEPTLTLTVMGWPTTGFAVVSDIAVEVASFATVIAAPVETDEAKSGASPP